MGSKKLDLVSIIEKTQANLRLTYKAKDNFEEQPFSIDQFNNNLYELSDFLKTAFVIVCKATDELIKEAYNKTNKNGNGNENEKLKIGYSLNYYPLYSEENSKGRAEFIVEGKPLRSYIFNENKLEIDEKDSYEKIREKITDILIPQHYYIDLLEVFYTNSLSTALPNQKLFSMKEYFEHTDASCKDAPCIVFDQATIPQDIVAFKKDYGIGDDYDYQIYIDYLKHAIDDSDQKSDKLLPYIQYCFSANDFFENESRGNLILYTNKRISKDLQLDIKTLLYYFLSSLTELEFRFVNEKKSREIYFSQLKTAIISILVDSYAHNISAHSLSALKWWFELRHKVLDKRFFVDDNNGLTLSAFEPSNLIITPKQLAETTEKYYSALGLDDRTYNKQFYSLFDFLQFNTFSSSENKQFGMEKLFSFIECNQEYHPSVESRFKGQVSSVEIINGLGPALSLPNSFNPRFPVPLDYALFPFFRFLRDKGAFWSGVTRDMAFGGESKTWYQILWEDFANNPLYLGTIAKSEGITKLRINIAVKDGENWISGRFVTIDLSLMEYEERIAKNPRMEIEYENKDFDTIKKYLNNEEILKIRDKERSEIEKVSSGLDLLKKLDNKLKELLFYVDKEDLNHCNDQDVHLAGFHEECHKSKNQYVEADRYTKYAFIRLGSCFFHFREILDTDKFTVFLPGGIVGEHALFTIFENTLRNIKHYKNDDELRMIRNNGIDLWISIEREKLNLTNVKLIENKSPELFKVNVWLGHKTKLLTQRDGENEYLWEKISKATKQPILDDYGAPRMGGNSQDKACAAMLFNNKFISIEDAIGKRNEDYFPWIHFNTNTTVEQFKSENDVPYSRIRCRFDESIYDNKVLEYKTSFNNSLQVEGYLKKHFYLWKSEDYYVIKNIDDIKGENISRFKFVLISSEITNSLDIKAIINEARQEGVIRLLFQTDNVNIKELIQKLDEIIPASFIEDRDRLVKIRDRRLKELYSIWLKKWLPFNNQFQIGLTKIPDSSLIKLVDNESKVEYAVVDNESKVEYAVVDNLMGSDIEIRLSHGGGDEPNSCNVRSHGMFWEKYFSKAPNKQPEDLWNANVVDKINMFLLMDLVEVVASNVFIFDNRLKSRMPNNKEKLQVFEKSLKLVVREEKVLADDESFKSYLESLIKEFGQPNVLVIHLSYIESLGYHETTKGFINLFIEKELGDLKNKDNFIFIITTGRGRNAWKDDLSPEYIKKTLFKPIESFIHAIESGISYNDNFDVKHNIIRVIFGS